MRKTGLALVALLVAYLAWPLWTGWQLREAVKTRDLAALEAHVDWVSLRQNLKPRLAALLTEEAEKRGGVAAQARKLLGPAVTDKAVDLLVTPEWLARTLRGREFILTRSERGKPPAAEPAQQNKGGAAANDPGIAEPQTDQADDSEDPGDPMPTRRLRWAFFEGPARFRVEAVHPRLPEGRVVAIFGLGGGGWKLVDIDYRR